MEAKAISEIGQLIELPGYRVDGVLGDGGMARVYRGTQLSLKRTVAIKVLNHKLADDVSIRSRFEQESLIIARLNHPNIIHVIDQGITDAGMPYFVMQYVKSIGLDKIMSQGGVSVNRALDVFIQITKALAYAHKNGVVHRDIKPANILVDYEGNVLVLDFGIAHFYGEDTAVHNTGKGDVMGTYAYMSPEQLASADSADLRSDLFSLGVIMYQHFAGQLPTGRFVEPGELNNNVSVGLNKIILQCLESDPNKRPSSADELKNQLLLVLRGGHIKSEQRERAVQGVKKGFQLLDIIKEDRYGAVYLVEESSKQQLLVLKKKIRRTQGYLEAKQLANIQHPNLINILGTSCNDRMFILVMEYLDGGSLADRMTQAFDLDSFFPVAIQIADALARVQEFNIVHGNLRPTNILFNSSGLVKVTDFGLEEHYNNQKMSNWYAVDGESAGVLSDIYSVGVIYFQMLIGQLPQRKHLRLVADSHFETMVDELQNLIKSMLSLDINKRPQYFREVADSLRTICGDQETVLVKRKSLQQVAKQPEDKIQFEKPPPKSHAVPLFLLLLLLVLFFTLQGYFLATGSLQELLGQLIEQILN